MYGLGHNYCPTCCHLVRAGRACGTCGAGVTDLLMFDAAVDQGMVSGWGNPGFSIGFDPFDDQLVINDGPIGFEPGTGEMDMNVGGIDFPLD